MSREKSIFEQMGGTYTEKDGILYPNLLIGEEIEAIQDTFLGKYGDLSKKYLSENHQERYYHLVRTGQLKQKPAGRKVPERESDGGKPDEAQNEGRLSSGSCVLCSGQTYGNDVPCSEYDCGAFLQQGLQKMR